MPFSASPPGSRTLAAGRAALLTCLALVMAWSAGCAPTEPAPRPRPPLVVLVVLDTLSAFHVSHLGYDRTTTPNLDALAADGISFEQTVSPASYTVASIPSLLTGRLPDRHGLVWYKMVLPESETTVAEMLAAAGYSTYGAIAVANGGPAYGNDKGFHQFLEVYEGPGGPGAQVFEHKGRTVHVPRADEFLPLVQARLDRRAPDERLLLYLHVLEPHGPFDPPLEFKQRIRDERFPHPYQEGDRDRIQAEMAALDPEQIPDPGQIERVIHLYDANILWADHELGRILEELRNRGLYDEALILVTADHGEAFWQHGVFGHGQQVYEPHVRVPLVIKPPKGTAPKGVRYSGLTSTLDVLPTIAHWLDLAQPENPLDGHSLVEVLNDPSRGLPPREILLRSRQDYQQFALRADDWKAIAQTERDEHGALRLVSVELYDLTVDPSETNDLAEAQPERAQALGKRILERLSELDGAARVGRGELSPADVQLLERLGYTGIGD